MRRAMFQLVRSMIEQDEKTVLLLADIGAMGFQDLIQKYPQRAMNIGIFESGMVGAAAGFAMRGFYPIVYGITPFIVERALEQLKLDFAYQGFSGAFLTTGAAYDFSTLGYSHFCQEDAAVMKQIPGFSVLTPGAPEELTALLRHAADLRALSYVRMSDYCNARPQPVEYGKAAVIRRGGKATVIAVSTMLDKVLQACADEDVTILYYTTLEPFDRQTLAQNCDSGRVLVCEPHFSGALTHDVVTALSGRAVRMDFVGMPKEILRVYGTKEEKDLYLNLTARTIADRLKRLYI